MSAQHGFLKVALSLGLVLILVGAAQVPRSAWASMEDAAIFYEELKQYGDWVDYGEQGPVWYPTKVQENWRPYVDGRWTPSEEGYVFETQEPWGYATYHHGNWMPTPEYGWVWVPGRTWYPNTVNWRTSPESEGADTSYIGWAPIPPPNYTPPPGYYPDGYSGGGPYRGSMENLITAPFWIFVKSANFLLGFSNPYTPSYSYWGCNCLMPPPAVPYYYRRTVMVNNYYTPGYYPAGYIAAGTGYYNWGPPIPYVARVTRINQTNINNYVQQTNIYQRRNVAPPPEVLARRAYFRNVLPPAMVARQPLPRGVPVQDRHMARANLVRPNLVNASVVKDVPTISAHLPKSRPGTGGAWQRGVPGAALPPSAVMPPNQQMRSQMGTIPEHQRLEPLSPSARKWKVPPTPGAEVVQPAPMHRPPRGPEVTGVAPGIQATTPPATAPYRMKPSPAATPQAGSPWQSGTPQDDRGRYKKPPSSEVVTHGTPGTPQASAPQEKYQPPKRQPGYWGRYEQTPETVVTPGRYPRQRQTQGNSPGSPPATTSSPPQVWPQRRPQAQQSQQQQSQQQQPQVMQPPQPQMQRQVQPPPQAPVQRQVQPTPPPQMPRRLQTPPQVQTQRPMQPPPQVVQQPRVQPQPQAPSRPQGQPQQQQQQGKKVYHQQNQ